MNEVLETMKDQLKEWLEPKFHPLVDSLANVAIKIGFEEGEKSLNNEEALKLFYKIITENKGRGRLDVHFIFEDEKSGMSIIG